MSDEKTAGLIGGALLVALEESFEQVRGLYLDKGSSFFETLAGISAAQASRPVSASCPSIAAHVEHVIFYLDTTLRFVRGERPEVDWSEIWRTVEAVTPEAWEDSQRRLKASYVQVRQLAAGTGQWDEYSLAGALGLLMHNAYHLGAIRQALCVLDPA